MSERKLFGTDGIRGKANVYPMTGEIAMRLGRAVTQYFQKISGKNKQPLIIVGKDTRLSCYMLEQAICSGICAQGGRVILTGPLPTPGIAFVTKSMRADAGIMISASHNNFDDNGIKLFDADGFKLPDEVELELEDMILNPEKMTVKTGGNLGRADRLKEVFGRYLVHTKAALESKFNLEGMRLVVDCANGAGYKVAPMIFKELGAEVFPIGVQPNGQNINSKCGSMHPETASEEVLKFRADLGICLDGDADRIVIIDDEGEPVDGDQLIALHAKTLLEHGKLNIGDTVVGTIMSNLGLEVYIKSLGLKFHRTKVGDRYILEYMRKHGSLLGGEPSGHIIFGEHATTGDGALAALKTIECMKTYQKPLKELVKEVALFPQVLKNAIVKRKPKFDTVPSIKKALEEAEKRMGDKGRVVLRYSGTEPLVRVMVEGEDESLVNEICDTLVAVVSKELS
ncbi:MAG: phosphoglucosamine mutase [Bacteriovoracaceae bacterium]|jgi:phosphoglucosamine mutase